MFKSTWHFEFDFLAWNSGGGEVPTAFCLKLFCFDSSVFEHCHFINVVHLCVNYINGNPCSFRVTFSQNIQQEAIPENDLINIYYKLPNPTIIFIKRAKLERIVFGGKNDKILSLEQSRSCGSLQLCFWRCGHLDTFFNKTYN